MDFTDEEKESGSTFFFWLIVGAVLACLALYYYKSKNDTSFLNVAASTAYTKTPNIVVRLAPDRYVDAVFNLESHKEDVPKINKRMPEIQAVVSTTLMDTYFMESYPSLPTILNNLQGAMLSRKLPVDVLIDKYVVVTPNY